MKHQHVGVRCEVVAKLFPMTIQHKQNGARGALQLTWTNSFNFHFRSARDFGNQYLAQLRIGFEQEKMVRRLHRQ